MQPLKKSTKTPFVRKPHSIRLVEIPPTTNSSRGIKLSVESAPRHPQPSEAHCHGLRISEWVHLFTPSRLLNSSLNGRTCLWRYQTWLLHFSLLNDFSLLPLFEIADYLRYRFWMTFRPSFILQPWSLVPVLFLFKSNMEIHEDGQQTGIPGKPGIMCEFLSPGNNLELCVNFWSILEILQN